MHKFMLTVWNLVTALRLRYRYTYRKKHEVQEEQKLFAQHWKIEIEIHKKDLVKKDNS